MPPSPAARRPGPLRRHAPLALTVAFVLFAVGVIIVNTVRSSEPDPAHCVRGTPITVASSTEKSDLLKHMADEYDGQGGCARVTVTGVWSGEAATAFAGGGWDAARGPRPDVWTPAAGAWIGAARERPGAADVVPETGPSVARTPLVFALPASVAGRLGWPNAELGWSDLARLASAGTGFTLGKINPTVATPGLLALLSAFHAGSTDVLDSGALETPTAMELEHTVEQGVVHYGNSEQEFLDNLAAAADRPGGASSYVSAVAVEEKAVFDYNRGNSAAHVPAPVPRTPKEPLVTFTPREGTFVSDSPYLTLTWPGTSQATKDAAADFYRWLADDHQQQELRANGFRTAAGAPPVPPVPANSATPRLLPYPSGEVVTKALSLWTDRLRKPANITLAVDLSGSMACGENSVSDPAGNCAAPTASLGEQTRLSRVKDAAGRALAKLRAGDTLSVRTFRSSDAAAPPWRLAVPPTVLGPPGSPTDGPSVLASAFASERPPGGGTPLYRTTREAITDVRSTADTSRINAVVLLTDGEESVEPGALDATVNAVVSDPAHPARLFAIAYSRDANTEQGAFARLQQLALSSGGYAYDATDPTDPQKNIDKVFEDLIANF